MKSRHWLPLFFLVFTVIGGSLSLSSTVDAKPSKLAKTKKASSKKSEKTSEKKKRKQVLVLDDSLVQGKVQRPEAFYILQSTELKYDDLEGRRNFTREIVDALEEDSVLMNQK